MAGQRLAQLSLDEIEEVLYLVRTNDAGELQSYTSSLAQQHGLTVGEILSQSVDPESGNTTLHFCAANGFADLLPKLLVELQTSQSGYENSAQAFVNLKNTRGNTALHWASLNGHLPVVKQLVEAKADLWIKNSAGHLAMFEAERAEKNEVVQFLLEAGGKEVEHTGNEEMAEVDVDGETTFTAGDVSQSSG